MSSEERVLDLARQQGVLRPRDLLKHGLARTFLQRLVESGALRKVGHGLYVPADREPSLHGSFAAVARQTPAAVVSLLSALRFHELTTQAPYEVWIAIPTRHRTPTGGDVPLRVVRMASRPHAAGVTRHDIDGVSVPIFDAEKTVVDCFRYRNKIGIDVALEAIREYLRRPGRNVDLLLDYAKIDRVSTTIQPYLEAAL
jgi:predicted transcriptional regulator of viral defense system